MNRPDPLFAAKVIKAAAYLRNDFPDIVGVEAVKHFKENFQNEGFTNQTLQKWDDVKRRTNPPESQMGKASTTRKILTGQTGDLGDSLDYNANFNTVAITTDLPYAQAHNEGTTTAGRGNKTTIPKRQFMGDSQALIQKLNNELERHLNTIFKP